MSTPARRDFHDSTGTVTQTYGTDEFGVPDAAQTQGPATQPMQYTGEPRDSTGLVYLRARMYDPGTGRLMLQLVWWVGKPALPVRFPEQCCFRGTARERRPLPR